MGFEQIKENIEKVLVGKGEVIELVLTCLLAEVKEDEALL